jgi:hypothetical protein
MNSTYTTSQHTNRLSQTKSYTTNRIPGPGFKCRQCVRNCKNFRLRMPGSKTLTEPWGQTHGIMLFVDNIMHHWCHHQDGTGGLKLPQQALRYAAVPWGLVRILVRWLFGQYAALIRFFLIEPELIQWQMSVATLYYTARRSQARRNSTGTVRSMGAITH